MKPAHSQLGDSHLPHHQTDERVVMPCIDGDASRKQARKLFSVVEFVDGRRLGPAFRFLQGTPRGDEEGKLLGYRPGTNSQQLEPILAPQDSERGFFPNCPSGRIKSSAPDGRRTGQVPYWNRVTVLARLMPSGRDRLLSEIDLSRITCCIQNMAHALPLTSCLTRRRISLQA